MYRTNILCRLANHLKHVYNSFSVLQHDTMCRSCTCYCVYRGLAGHSVRVFQALGGATTPAGSKPSLRLRELNSATVLSGAEERPG